MKSTFFALFLLLSIVCEAQIPKKANTIIIVDSLSQEQFYNKINDLLFESGYGILNTDKSQGTITTTEKSYKNGSIKLNILIKDSKVLLRGDFKTDLSIEIYGVTSNPSWSAIENTGGKNSAYRNAWNEMNKVAESIPGNKTYLIN
jgi:hypothetical protein